MRVHAPSRRKLKNHFEREYRFGFSLLGLIAALLPMIPNLFWVILPPVSSALPANDPLSPLVGAVATVCQSLMIGALVIVISVHRRSISSKKLLVVLGGACLAGYWGLWFWYFTAPITPTLLLLMAVLPSAYFICLGLCLENYPSLIPASLFALIHVTTTAVNYF